MLDEPRLARIVARRQAVLPFPIKGGKLYLYNHNPLLRARYPGTLGIKTGFTDAAGRCLVAAVQRNGHRLGVVLLHSPDPGGQADKLLRPRASARSASSSRKSAGRGKTGASRPTYRDEWAPASDAAERGRSASTPCAACACWTPRPIRPTRR